MATTKEDVLEFISNMSVLELSELVKEFEECQYLSFLSL
jgi:large subunit ribosomal protein L7/L12